VNGVIEGRRGDKKGEKVRVYRRVESAVGKARLRPLFVTLSCDVQPATGMASRLTRVWD